MSRYPNSPGFMRAFWTYFRSFLATLSAMVTLTPLTLTATGVLPTYAVHRTTLVASASFLCVLAFSTVFYFRKELAPAREFPDSRGSITAMKTKRSIRPILLAVPVFLAAASGWALIQYESKLSTSTDLAETIYFAEQRAPESDFAFREWQLLTSNSPEEERLSEMKKFRNAWPVPTDLTREEILDKVQAPPFSSGLWFWYLLAFVCGELSLCLAALRGFQREIDEIQHNSAG